MIERIRCWMDGGHDYDIQYVEDEGYRFRISTCKECGTTKVGILP